MRALFGLLQLGLGIGGLVALLNGQWLITVLTWLGAFLIGLLGSRLVRSATGVSQIGNDAVQNIPRAIEQLRAGNYRAAEGLSLGAVNAFRLGGDQALLPMALLIRAVALGANKKFEPAKELANDAERLSRNIPDYADIRPIFLQIQRELSAPQPDSYRLVAEFLVMNDES